jgi:hypothetical protein
MSDAKPLTPEEEALWRTTWNMDELEDGERVWATLDAARAEVERLRGALSLSLAEVERSYDTDPVELPDTRRGLLFSAIMRMRAALSTSKEQP